LGRIGEIGAGEAGEAVWHGSRTLTRLLSLSVVSLKDKFLFLFSGLVESAAKAFGQHRLCVLAKTIRTGESWGAN
jgi:hypothetical protein